MEDLISDLPARWGRTHRSESPFPSWRFQHQYLDVEITVSTMDPADLGKHIEGEYVYIYLLQWSGKIGGIEDSFEPPEDVTTRTDAANWTIALMQQISQQFEPGDTDYVSRAMRATKGESVSSGSRNSGHRNSDGQTCPVCDAPFYQFRGFDTYEQAQNHFEFVDDEEHEGWELSVEDI